MNTNEPTEAPQDGAPTPPASSAQAQPARGLRLPSPRASAVLATVMLGIGVAVGAAIGPGPASSFAGGPAALSQRLPALLAAIVARQREAAPAAAQAAAAANAAEPAASPTTRRKRKRKHASAASSAPAASASESSSTSSSGEASETSSKSSGGSTHQSKLPAISSVWLIQLAGGTFAQALAQPTAAPYIDAQLVPAGTLLSGWSALEGSAFASEATLAEPVSAEATPPLLHSIVQPPCPEGAAGAACAPETPGQLTSADEFLKATLSSITSTPAYREHGLVLVTFASVGVATQAGLPAGASSATLTYKPPAGVLLLSPFAQKGSRSSVTYNPTSPRQSLEKLLH